MRPRASSQVAILPAEAGSGAGVRSPGSPQGGVPAAVPRPAPPRPGTDRTGVAIQAMRIIAIGSSDEPEAPPIQASPSVAPPNREVAAPTSAPPLPPAAVVLHPPPSVAGSHGVSGPAVSQAPRPVPAAVAFSPESATIQPGSSVPPQPAVAAEPVDTSPGVTSSAEMEEITEAEVAPESDRDSEGETEVVPVPAPVGKKAPPPRPRRSTLEGAELGPTEANGEAGPTGDAIVAPAPRSLEAPPRAKPAEAPESEPEGEEDKPKARLRRPWWDDLFGEDFSRALARPTDRQIRQEVDFIEESLGIERAGTLLDLACGAGYHAVELASRGYAIVGYDLSLHQLALAADVAQDRAQRLNLLQGDMREMAFGEMFDGIFCWNTSFGYFEEEKNIIVAQRIFKALKPGGNFLVDVINRDFVSQDQPLSVWFEGDSCVCMDDMSVDYITSRLRVKRSLILDDGRKCECHYSIRLYSLHELGKLLHDVGFRVTQASGHPATPGVFLGPHSPRIIILAQRP